MKSTLIIFAVLLGVALAEEEDARLIGGQEEARGPATAASLISLGIQVVILLALINFVTSLKDSIDFDNLFGKGGDTGYASYDTGYTASAPATGYAAAPPTGYGAPTGLAADPGSSYSSYRRQGNVASRTFNDSPVMQRLSARVINAIEKFTE